MAEQLRAESFGQARQIAHRRWGTFIGTCEDYQAQTFTVMKGRAVVAVFDCSPPSPEEVLEQIRKMGESR